MSLDPRQKNADYFYGEVYGKRKKQDEKFGIRFECKFDEELGAGLEQSISEGKIRYEYYTLTWNTFANRQTLIENLALILKYAEIRGLLGETLKPELTIMPEYSSEELMNFELESFGFYLTNHPITEYKLKTNSKVIELKDIKSYFDKIIEAIVMVDRVKEITTKKSEKMMFITASDELSKTDIVVFPRVYNVTEELNRGDIIYIKGKVERRYDEMQIIASNIKKLN